MPGLHPARAGVYPRCRYVASVRPILPKRAISPTTRAQQVAYDSTGHCVVLAGPGSGKTKTLVLKLARIMAEDVHVPRGAACITYSHECARELTRRLERLGLREATNLFVGTVHGFCLRHLLMPYGRLADLPVPFPLYCRYPAAEQPTAEAGWQSPLRCRASLTSRWTLVDIDDRFWTAGRQNGEAKRNWPNGPKAMRPHSTARD